VRGVFVGWIWGVASKHCISLHISYRRTDRGRLSVWLPIRSLGSISVALTPNRIGKETTVPSDREFENRLGIAGICARVFLWPWDMSILSIREFDCMSSYTSWSGVIQSTRSWLPTRMRHHCHRSLLPSGFPILFSRRCGQCVMQTIHLHAVLRP